MHLALHNRMYRFASCVMSTVRYMSETEKIPPAQSWLEVSRWCGHVFGIPNLSLASTKGKLIAPIFTIERPYTSVA